MKHNGYMSHDLRSLYTALHEMKKFPNFLGLEVKDDFFRCDVVIKCQEKWKEFFASGDIRSCAAAQLFSKKEDIQNTSLFSSKTLWVVDELSFRGKRGDEFVSLLLAASYDQYFLLVADESFPKQLSEEVKNRGSFFALQPIKPWERESYLETWLHGFLKKRNKKISSEGAHALIAAYSQDRQGLSSELEKLVLYKKDVCEITLADVEALSTIDVKSTLWNVLDALLSRDLRGVVHSLTFLDDCNEIALLRFMRGQIERFLVAESGAAFRTKTQVRQYEQAMKLGHGLLLSWITAFEMHEVAIKSGKREASMDEILLLFLNLLTDTSLEKV